MCKPLFAFSPILSLAQPGSAAEDDLTAAARKNFGEYLELLAIPNIRDKPDDMRRNAAFLEKAFQRRGVSTRLLDNAASRPLVAQFDGAASGARTILSYIHFDGQPAMAHHRGLRGHARQSRRRAVSGASPGHLQLRARQVRGPRVMGALTSAEGVDAQPSQNLERVFVHPCL